MGVPSSASQAPARRTGRSVGRQFAARLAVPATVLVLAWAAVAAAVFGGALHGAGIRRGHLAIVEAGVVAGAGLLVALAVVALTGAFARRLAREAADLAELARQLADEQLPAAIARLRAGDAQGAGTAEPAGRPGTAPLPAARTAEFAAVTEALASMRAAAIASVTAETGLRSGFRQVLTSLGRRNQSLLHRQLRIIDTLEQQAASPAALADLFALDHLTTRMRRHAESLTVLSGAPPARPRTGPVPVMDVIRAAVAETEDYKRVSVRTETEEVIAASAVNDVIHLLAELVENATLFSPSATRVEVRAERVANGFAIEVEDRGLGIAPDQLAEMNGRLANPPDFDLVDADRLGLFVAGRLAARHDIEVSLSPSPYRGTKAIVMLPEGLVLPSAAPAAATAQTARDQAAEAARLPAPDGLSLVAAAPAVPPSGAGRPRTTANGLPRRVRTDSQPELPDGLGDTPARQPRAERAPAPSRAPAPEDARRLAASLQRSWHRSRTPDDDTGDDTGDDPGAGGGRQDEHEPTPWNGRGAIGWPDTEEDA